ncbi:MAG: hypothetical protein B7Y99_10070 [Caulobacterales bacterium 32-69-10]|nr:MAG: hypothetical protein B7Y99_10070 [Caulobacterales bacterium 32-69-10]
MSLKELYRAELDRKAEAREQMCASFEEAKDKLEDLYRSIMEDEEFLRSIHAEVELHDDDLRIDPGPVMIVVTAQLSGDFHMEYEVKKPDDYQTTVLGDVHTIADVERALAKLLATYARHD